MYARTPQNFHWLLACLLLFFCFIFSIGFEPNLKFLQIAVTIIFYIYVCMSALALGLKFVACAKIININRLCSFSTMANFTVRFGLNLERNLQRADTQMLLIGRKTMLNAVDFNKNLTAKLAPFVDEELFKRGMAQLNASGGSVPLYLNMVKVCFG